jgi:amino acid transporter
MSSATALRETVSARDPRSVANPTVFDAAKLVPEATTYRLKKRMLGKPLHSEQLAHETLGKPTALAVFASDNLSSCAYASEEILRVLLPVIGLSAFSLVTPITGALLVVLGFLILSYRQTIKAYPSAGGAYIVTRDNFGLIPAQVAGVALLTDYVLTVSVSVAAGTDALASAFLALEPYKLWIAIGFVLLIAYGNLRGVKESGKLFAVPTYFFVVNMFLLLGVGLYRLTFSTLPKFDSHTKGLVEVGSHRPSGLLMGASVFLVLKAFGSGGAAVTGVEAISNGVPAFRAPAWKNARDTLVIMGSLLGVMFLGLSILAARVHAIPYESGTPTVISLVGKAVYGGGPIAHALYLMLQAGTMLILVLAANTSFADFPRLASFHAGDNFMPRQFMTRGHRLVFSNGILFLAGAGIITLIGTGGKVSRLIPLYAIGVFTSFTLSQAGMAKHHLTHKESGWKSGLFINGMGALLSFLVLAIVATVKFTEGAWVIMVLIPIMVLGLVRLNRAYEAEAEELHTNAAAAAVAPPLRRHVVITLVDHLDVAAARAIQYGRSLRASDFRVVHFDLDPWKSHVLTEDWSKLGFDRVPLDVIECADRRVSRAAVEIVLAEVRDNDTEVSVLIPRREFERSWHRVLHDRSSDSISKALGVIPHCNVTIVPYHLGTSTVPLVTDEPVDTRFSTPIAPSLASALLTDTSILPIERVLLGSAPIRQRLIVAGRIRALRVQPFGGNPGLEATLVDESGELVAIFTGRRSIGGVQIGTYLLLEGTIANRNGRRVMLNPAMTLLQATEPPQAPHH